MIIAKQKKQENIAEYILYIWQLEDIMRAGKFDASVVAGFILSGMSISEKDKKQAEQWYEDICEMMLSEKIQEKGHLQFIVNSTNELNDFHLQLLKINTDQAYNSLFRSAYTNIEELKPKLNSSSENDVEICMNALYGLMLMRIQKKEISENTSLAMKTFSNFLAGLSQRYRLFEEGELDIYKSANL